MNKKSFFLGIIVGVVSATLVHFALRPPHMFGFHQRRWSGQEFKHFFKKELDLTKEQEQSFDPMLEAFHEKMKAARAVQLEEARQAMDTLKSEINSALSEDQKQRLTEMRQRFEHARDTDDHKDGEEPRPTTSN